MKFRIAIWAGVGALIVVLWDLIFTMSPATPGSLRTLAHLTCPIALADRHPLSFNFVLVANAATYALIGAIVEVMRRQYKSRRFISN